jgi:flagellar biosynthesis/type III secretory pathway chaperone
MEAHLREIALKVEGEVSCLSQLLELLDQEREILLHGRHQDLMGTTQRKISIFHQLNQVQEERRALQQGYATEDLPQPTLGQLSRRLPQPRQGEFRRALLTADDLARKVMSANQANQGYVSEALATVDHLLGLLSGGGVSQGYSPQGATAPPNRPRLFAREV